MLAVAHAAADTCGECANSVAESAVIHGSEGEEKSQGGSGSLVE